MAEIIGGYDTNAQSSQASLRMATISRVGTKDYLDVRAVVVGSTPNTENFDGSDCTGSDEAANRTLTLTNTATSQNEMITVNGQVQTITTDYTISHNSSSSVITFVRTIFNSDKIDVRYFT